MMGKCIYSFDVLLALLYLGLFLFYAKIFLSKHQPLGRFFTASLPVILSLHFIKLLLQGVYAGHCPIVGFNETFSFTAFALGVIYLIIERHQRYFATGAIFLGIILLFQSVSVITGFSVVSFGEQLQRIPFGYHAPLALFGIAALATSAIYSGIYLATFYSLKSKHPNSYLREVPSLETIENMQSLSSTIGVVLISIALVIGLAIARIYNMAISIYDPKIIISILVLVIFGSGVIGSKFCSFSGKKKAIIALVGFLVALLSMTIVRLYLPSFHRF